MFVGLWAFVWKKSCPPKPMKVPNIEKTCGSSCLAPVLESRKNKTSCHVWGGVRKALTCFQPLCCFHLSLLGRSNWQLPWNMCLLCQFVLFGKPFLLCGPLLFETNPFPFHESREISWSMPTTYVHFGSGPFLDVFPQFWIYKCFHATVWIINSARSDAFSAKPQCAKNIIFYSTHTSNPAIAPTFISNQRYHIFSNITHINLTRPYWIKRIQTSLSAEWS